MTSNMTLIDTNDRWLLKLPSSLPIVSFIPFARALEDRLSRRTPILPIDTGGVIRKHHAPPMLLCGCNIHGHPSSSK